MNEKKDEPWSRPECWDCSGELKRKLNSDLWRCIKCRDEYLSCSRCEKKGEWTFEWADNTKGWECDTCQRYFCCHCFQHTGSTHYTDEWKCDACINHAGLK